MHERQYNVVVGIVVAAIVLVVLPFAVAVLNSKAGEAAAALGGVFGGFAAALAAYIGVRTTLAEQARADDRRRADDLTGLRLALHTEVGQIAFQCLAELSAWRGLAAGPTEKNLRTARLPPLTIYPANAYKIGLLTRAEILALVGFAGTLHDIGVVLVDLTARGVQEPNVIMLLLSNACGLAADFFESVPGLDGAHLDKPFIARLRSAQALMAAARPNVLPAV
jgi:hypothetical protein